MTDKKSFVIYHDQGEIFNSLSDEDAGKLIKAILEYSISNSELELSPILKIAFIPIKQQIQRDSSKWQAVLEKRKQAGRLGGIKTQEMYRKQAKQANASSSETGKSSKRVANQAVNVTGTVTVNEYNEWLSAYNLQYNTKYKTQSLLGNFSFWREQYTQEELLASIPKISEHKWLGDKHNPELVLRQRDKSGNPVDRIGELLSLKSEKRYA